jgi:opacity protein-like surface antigen
MKSFAISVAALVVAALPLVAQQHQADHDKPVAGGGTLPAGWKGRLDSGGSSIAGVKVTPMGGGLHFVTGPAGIYYREADKPTGGYAATATFTQMEPAAHPEAYGLFVGGSNLDGANQKYTYFLVRQDGKFLIKRRAGSATPTIADWSDSSTIHKTDKSGKMSNTLAIEVARDKVRFLINGIEVSSADADKIDTAGIAGIRVNHNLNVHVEGFAVKPR